MKNKLLYLLTGLLLAAACSEKQPEPPPGIISKEEMTGIIMDLHIIDAAIALNTFDMSAADFDKKKLYAQVFKKHKVSQKEFDTSFDYYSNHLEDMKEIYTMVVDSLSRKQAETR